jgi:hypothetical protein
MTTVVWMALHLRSPPHHFSFSLSLCRPCPCQAPPVPSLPVLIIFAYCKHKHKASSLTLPCCINPPRTKHPILLASRIVSCHSRLLSCPTASFTAVIAITSPTKIQDSIPFANPLVHFVLPPHPAEQIWTSNPPPFLADLPPPAATAATPDSAGMPPSPAQALPGSSVNLRRFDPSPQPPRRSRCCPS